MKYILIPVIKYLLFLPIAIILEILLITIKILWNFGFPLKDYLINLNTRFSYSRSLGRYVSFTEWFKNPFS